LFTRLWPTSAVRTGKDISAVTRRNLFRLRLINNSGELTLAGDAVLRRTIWCCWEKTSGFP
jgi:hypothetical protein